MQHRLEWGLKIRTQLRCNGFNISHDSKGNNANQKSMASWEFLSVNFFNVAKCKGQVFEDKTVVRVVVGG